MSGSYTRISLRVTAQTRFGETVHVSGNSFALGKFNPVEAVELVTTPQDYPVWTTSHPIMLPRYVPVQYLYAIFSGGRFSRWERVSAERQLIPDGRSMLVEEHFGAIGEEGGVTDDLAGQRVRSVSYNDAAMDTGASEKGKESGHAGVILSGETAAGVTTTQHRKSLPPPVPVPVRTLPVPAPSLPSSVRPSPVDCAGLRSSAPELGGIIEGRMATDADLGMSQSPTVAGAMDWRVRLIRHPSVDVSPSERFMRLARGKSEGGRLYLVCFHLPCVLSKGEDGQWTAEWAESLIARTEDSVSKDMATTWIGGIIKPGLTDADHQQIRDILRPMDCVPIFIDEELCASAYIGFCKQVMWPLFHNVDVLDVYSACWGPSTLDASQAWDQHEANEWWAAYQRVNQIFAEETHSRLRPTDVVWIHDYHLMLMPQMLRGMAAATTAAPPTPSAAEEEEKNEKEEKQKQEQEEQEEVTSGGSPAQSSDEAAAAEISFSIIFFLHIPFPTGEIFRSMEKADHLLYGMLAADMVGFHTFNHARHFLNVCKRQFGLNYHWRRGGLIGIDFHGKTVAVVMSHVGIEPQQLYAKASAPTTLEETDRLQQMHPGKVLVVGVDFCQRLSGIPLKLLAFEHLLNEYPVWRDRAVLVQICLRPGSRKPDEEHSSAEIRQLVARINDRFGPVVDYRELAGNKVRLEQRLALWRAGTVFFSSAVREGLNLFPLEYIYARTQLVEETDAASAAAAAAAVGSASVITAGTSLGGSKGSGLHLLLSRSPPSSTGSRTPGSSLSGFNTPNVTSGTSTPNSSSYGVALPRQSAEDMARDPGAVIVSEFSSCASLLNGATRINPFDLQGVASALDQVLTMRKRERRSRMKRDLNYIKSRPSSKWTRQLLSDLYTLCRDPRAARGVVVQMESVVDGEGGDLGHEMAEQSFVHLRPAAVKSHYTGCQRRLFLLDYGGSLIDKERLGKYIKRDFTATTGRRPSDRMIAALELLARDPCNSVYVISGLQKVHLAAVLGHIQRLGLAAQNGLSYAPPVHYPGASDSNATAASKAMPTPPRKRTTSGGGKRGDGDRPFFLSEGTLSSLAENVEGTVPGTPVMTRHQRKVSGESVAQMQGREWTTFDFGVDWDSIRGVVEPLLQLYAARTNGSSIRWLETGVTWNYFATDPEWGQMQATKLASELEQAVKGYDVKVQHLRGTVEVVPRGVHKGTIVRRILRDEMDVHGLEAPPNFIFCIGDDTSDEKMFQAVYSFLSDMPVEAPSTDGQGSGQQQQTVPHTFTCTIGKKPSHAGLYVHDVREVEDLLASLVDLPP